MHSLKTVYFDFFKVTIRLVGTTPSPALFTGLLSFFPLLFFQWFSLTFYHTYGTQQNLLFWTVKGLQLPSASFGLTFSCWTMLQFFYCLIPQIRHNFYTMFAWLYLYFCLLPAYYSVLPLSHSFWDNFSFSWITSYRSSLEEM